MIRPHAAHLHQTVWSLLLLAILVDPFAAGAMAQQPPAATEETPGQFFTVAEPITSESFERLKAATREYIDSRAREGQKPILVFEFVPGEVAPGTSARGVCSDLAEYIAGLGGAKWTVAYVPTPVQGYAVLPVIACTEIVMGPSSSLGPITPEGQPFAARYREEVRQLAISKARDPDLLLGMLDRDADLRLVRTADKAVHYVMAENLDAFQKSHQVIEERPAWDGGLRGVLTAQRGRDEGFCTRTADNPDDVRSIYHISGRLTVEDPILGQLPRRCGSIWKARWTRSWSGT